MNTVSEVFSCAVCGYVHDEATGDPDHAVAPGTAWSDIHDTWLCPECGAPKSDFEHQQF